MEAMVLEMLRTHTQIFWKKCPSNGMNPWTSITIVFWRANKAKLGILLGFYPTYALECSAINHFARENPRKPNYEWTEQPLHVINPKCLAYLTIWRTRVVRTCREGQFWKRKKKLTRLQVWFQGPDILSWYILSPFTSICFKTAGSL